jgi:hypothetical protein
VTGHVTKSARHARSAPVRLTMPSESEEDQQKDQLMIIIRKVIVYQP